MTAWLNFNPRSPHGERRPPPPLETDTQAISIHAPRTGSDSAQRQGAPICAHFNPRSPHGERRFRRLARPPPPLEFQSTLPARGATVEELRDLLDCAISIHAPRTGSDRGRRGIPPRPRHFNPRSPHGERLLENAKKELAKKFQSTLPARGATQSHTSY